MRLLAGVTALLIAAVICHVEGKSKPLSVTLSSSWKSTPYILEASEFVAEESKEAFWRYVDNIVMFNSDGRMASKVEHDKYRIALKAANMAMGSQPSSVKEGLLKFALSIRSYSPKIEMHRQLACTGDKCKEGCKVYYDVGGKRSCKLTDEMINDFTANDDEDLLPTDHVYPVGCKSKKRVIVYGDMVDKNFPAVHKRMKQLVTSSNDVCYVLRHHYLINDDDNETPNTRLSGYGVELAVKSTEYKAIDDTKVKDGSSDDNDASADDVEIDGFDFVKLRHLHPSLGDQLTTFRDHLVDKSDDLKALKVWQLQDLSFQAAAYVMAQDDRLKALQDVSQNFPRRVRSLVKQNVPDDLRKEIKMNRGKFGQLEVGVGDSALFVNGMKVHLDEGDVFELLDLLRDESRLLSGLSKLGLDGEESMQAVRLRVSSDGDDDADDDGDHVLDIRDQSVVWLNNIETDDLYKRWPANLHDLLRPAFPGTLRRIRRNLHHMLLVIKPDHETAKHLVESAEIFWANDVPLRIGVVIDANDDEGAIEGSDDVTVAMSRALSYVVEEEEGRSGKVFDFIVDVYKSLPDDSVLTFEHLKKRFTKKYKSADFENIVSASSEYDEGRANGRSYKTRSGLVDDVSVLLNGKLLTPDEISPDNFEQTVLEHIMAKTPFFQRAVYMGQLRNDMDCLDFMMDQPNVVPRINKRILDVKSQKNVDLTDNMSSRDIYENVDKFSKLSSGQQNAVIASGIQELYMAKSDSDKHMRPVSMWIVADVCRRSGRNLIYNALKHVKSSGKSRVAIMHNPSSSADDDKCLELMRSVENAVSSQQAVTARNFITKLMRADNAEQVLGGAKQISEFFVGGWNRENYDKLAGNPALTASPTHQHWATNNLGLKRGENAVVVNGKLIGPLDSEESFTVHDFELIESLAYKGKAEVVEKFVRDVRKQSTSAEKSDLVMRATSHLSSMTSQVPRQQPMRRAQQQHSVITSAPSGGESSSFEITAVIDPASNQAQVISKMLQVLQQVLGGCKIQVYMNCRDKLSDLPVKRFYDYVLDAEPKFKVDGRLSGARSRFVDLPPKSLLTLTMHPPEGWMVGVTRSPHDLDNLRLGEVEADHVSADYQLEHLILEGQARDLTTGSPPRGLQFTLGADSKRVDYDTIVMANLGYFQLKTSPGVWHLNLRKGRSRDIYGIISVDGRDTGGETVRIEVGTFKSRAMLIKVAKKSDMLNEDVLDDVMTNQNHAEQESTSGGGIWDSIKSTILSLSGHHRPPPTTKPSTFGSASADDDENTEAGGNSTVTSGHDDVINVFSLASGHLYERLMRIMMLSVMRTTHSKVKFWVLKNYISPQFKDFLPYMAETYGFEYELVQYKWPRWLNQQTEKQRTMWGYKILFLDVLFPLDVDKIIFVDADQIVRADLKELRDLDLEGNPYGYTPFCDDRKEMDGFRFWKGGYWANHLAGRKYHISAIYVVDLNKFRQVAAGDRLRGQYQGLSQDPNSLANLDQDLPNNMIHQVGIKSLPQEWLWCATWCSEESKSRAKTIDLCNNPLTKEPKLEAAVRIVPEWSGFDDEIKLLKERWERKLPPQHQSNRSNTRGSGGSTHTEL